MKFLAIVSPPSIYHGCSTRKTFWEEKFAGKKQDLFKPVITNYDMVWVGSGIKEVIPLK